MVRGGYVCRYISYSTYVRVERRGLERREYLRTVAVGRRVLRKGRRRGRRRRRGRLRWRRAELGAEQARQVFVHFGRRRSALLLATDFTPLVRHVVRASQELGDSDRQLGRVARLDERRRRVLAAARDQPGRRVTDARIRATNGGGGAGTGRVSVGHCGSADRRRIRTRVRLGGGGARRVRRSFGRRRIIEQLRAFAVAASVDVRVPRLPNHLGPASTGGGGGGGSSTEIQNSDSG